MDDYDDFTDYLAEDDFLDDIEYYTDADYGYEDYEPNPYDGTYSEE